jgi:hypothetical protein
MSKVFDHLLPAFRTYALLPDEERIGWIRQARWINYSRTDQILGRLAELLDYPPRERMPCLLLFGATGMGKTHLIEKFLRDHRSVSTSSLESLGCRWPTFKCRARLTSATSTGNGTS